MLIAVIAGVVGSLSLRFFISIYKFITSRLLSFTFVPVFLWPVAGAAFASFLIYRIEPGARGEGLPSYIISLKKGDGRLPVSETFYKFLAALLTLGTFGNGGFLGPCGRVSAGIMSALQRVVPKKLVAKEHISLFPICGLAAVFGALVHSSIGAGIFAVEIIQKSSMRYRQLFPAVLASMVSVYFSQLLGFEPLFTINAAAAPFEMSMVGILILLSISAGFLGRGFTMLYALISKLFHRDLILPNHGIALRAITGSLSAFLIVWFINPDLVGTSSPVFTSVLTGFRDGLYGKLGEGVPFAVVLIILILLKSLANSLTVGSGMSAGFAGPAMLIGLLAGAFFAEIFGISPETPEYFSLLAAGFAGVFSSTMNTPIATSVLTIELFGMFYSLPAGLAAVIGFQVNRHHTLYDMVFEEDEE